MNKRLITIFLAILLICTLCVTIVACGDKDNNDDSNPNGEQTDTPSSPIEPSSSNLVFELKTNDTYEVVGYTGEPISIVIPATYHGKAVTSIGIEAFDHCSSLTSVTIGNSVTSIGDWAFHGCTSLSSVNYLGTIEQWCGITFGGYYANPLCNGAKLYLNGELVEDLVIPNTVTEIKDCAFSGCDSLHSVTIGNSVTNIGNGAFENCNSLSSVTIGNSVTSIGERAFYYCDSLTSVTIGNSVTSIGDDAFRYCYKLVEVYNLSSLTIEKGSSSNGYVGYYALDVYTSLDTPSKLSTDSDGYIIRTNGEEKTLVRYTGSESELTLPSGITSINQGAFFYDDTITSVVIPDSVTSIGDEAFYFCNSLSSVTIPDSVTSIGDWAFWGCASLSSVTIGNSVTSIGEMAFYYCYSLTSVTIGNSVTSIGAYAFFDCYSLSSVTIGNSVTSIGERAFHYCYKLVEVYNLSNLTIEKGSDSNGYVGAYALDVYTSLDTPSKLSTDSKGYIIYTNGEEKILVGYTGNETELTLPSGITSINQGAFYNNDKITSVTIPDSVTSIGERAFYDCLSLNIVYYNGTAEEWSGISIGDYNSYLINATRYYYSETEPVEEGNYWHYVGGIPTPW